ncbi:histidine phosphatase family protein [Algihabitans albus]|uniref:histidine phosphatase family protein n=1 Tax=Algihabitans albus TaxID=2164067 RepID=UPI000E5D8BAC|nr:histidine phosphatase family protein [Algihabitans albus]
MTVVLLVRHGQARFGTSNYDRLSELGERQARLTGAHLAREGRSLATALSGALVRQAETARQALSGWNSDLRAAADPRFDEYPADALFDAYLPLAAARDPRLNQPMAALQADPRLFHYALTAVTGLWADGTLPAPRQEEPAAFENWQDFQARVRNGLEDLMVASAPHDTAVIFTSGGVIGTATALALGLDGQAAMALGHRTLNAGITELHYGRNGFALVGFNTVAHLRLAGGETLITYR